MAQHSARHLYLTVRFAAKNTSPWAGETATWGHRLAVRDSDTPFGLSDGQVSLPSFLVNDASVSRQTTNWDINQGWAGDAGVGGINITDQDQDSLMDRVWTYLQAIKAYISSQYELESCRLYPVGSNGTSVCAPNVYEPMTAVAGGSATMLSPAAALVISTSSSARGRKGRGRWYVGPVGTSLAGADAIITAPNRAAMLTPAKALLDGFREAGGVTRPSYTPIVWNRGSNSGCVINEVRVGDEIDFQQRRRRQRDESYSKVGLD